jgi:hypothetical protein
MISCCAGAELQLREESAAQARARNGTFEVVLRELYPTKSDLYERSRMLEAQYLDLECPESEIR